jgi:hypothetical protein
MQPTIILLSVHKGASTFLAGEFASAAQCLLPGLVHLPVHYLQLRGRTLADMALPERGVLATRVYPHLYDALIESPVPRCGRFAGKRLVMVRRDPRDVAVSLYYSAAHSHPVPPGDPAPFLARRRRLLELGVSEGIRAETAAPALAEFRQAMDFLDRFPQTLDAPYEQLVIEPDRWLSRVADHLGWATAVVPVLGDALRPCLQPPPRERPDQHKRRITPGNWREVFDDRLCALFQHEAGSLIARAGYERSGVPAAAH